MSQTIAGLIGGVPSMGSYSGVIEELEEVLNNPESTLSHIGEVIEKDPDLTARLLKLGNSSFYGFPSRLETVSEAITLIGIQQVYDLIVAAQVIELFEGVSPEFVSMQSFWRHSLSCGVVARLLALDRRLPKPDKFFVAGLLHDVGRLILFSRIPGEVKTIFETCQARRCLLREAESDVLGFDHAAIGGELLKSWSYPPNLVQAIAYHHHPLSAGVFQLEASVVHVADFLCNGLQLGTSGEQFIPPLKMPAWERTSLEPGQLESILTTADEQIEAVEDAFLTPGSAK